MTALAMVDRPLVYVAGPYGDDPAPNTKRAMDVADWMWGTGLIAPIVPHLSILWDVVRPRGPEEWYDYDLAILARCDALFRMPGTSDGANREVDFAMDSGIPVFKAETQLLEWAATVLIDD